MSDLQVGDPVRLLVDLDFGNGAGYKAGKILYVARKKPTEDGRMWWDLRVVPVADRWDGVPGVAIRGDDTVVGEVFEAIDDEETMPYVTDWWRC